MISDEAVEAAARVFYHLQPNGTPLIREREQARAALEAALPHLLASKGCGTGHSGEQPEPAVSATAAIAPVPCDGCGAAENSKRCMGCLHDFGTPDSAWVHSYAATPTREA